MGSSRHPIAWGFVGGGILTIILGIIFIAQPYASAAVLGMFAGIAFIAVGVMCIVNSAGGWGLLYQSGWLLANGILDVILGIMFIAWPLAGGWMLSLMLGCGIIVTAIFTLVYGGAISKAINKGMFALDIIWSILFLVIGIWMLVDPGMMTTLFGWFALFEGTWLVLDGFAR